MKNGRKILKVKELIAFLQTLDPEMEVCRVGHMGDIWEMNSSNFSVEIARPYSYKNGHLVDFNLREPERAVLNVCSPDIGEGPGE